MEPGLGEGSLFLKPPWPGVPASEMRGRFQRQCLGRERSEGKRKVALSLRCSPPTDPAGARCSAGCEAPDSKWRGGFQPQVAAL